MIETNAMRQGAKDVARIATENAGPACGTRGSRQRPNPCHTRCVRAGLRWRMGISLLVMLLAFLRAGLMDEAHVFIAPKILGGNNARHAVGGTDPARLADAYGMRLVRASTSAFSLRS